MGLAVMTLLLSLKSLVYTECTSGEISSSIIAAINFCLIVYWLKELKFKQ